MRCTRCGEETHKPFPHAIARECIASLRATVHVLKRALDDYRETIDYLIRNHPNRAEVQRA